MSAIERVDDLLREVCQPQPRSGAWEELHALVSREAPDEPHVILALRLSAVLESLSGPERKRALPQLGKRIARSPWRDQLLGVFAGSTAPAGRTLALMAAGRRGFRDVNKRGLLLPLLKRGVAPGQVQARALGRALARGDSTNGAEKLLDAYLSGCGAASTQRRLEYLSKFIGRPAFLSRRLEQAKDLIQVRCPRCGEQAPRVAMERHLLIRHALVLEGKGVRSAWRLIDGWLANYHETGAKQWLRRCLDLLKRLEDPQGVRRLQQRMLLQGIAVNSLRRRLLIGARAARASLCPICFSQAPVPRQVFIEPVMQSHGLLTRQGYRLHIDESGLTPQLRIETPTEILYQDTEPGRFITARGIILLVMGPLAALAIVLAVVGARGSWVVTFLFMAGLAYGWLRLRDWFLPTIQSRAIDAAWSLFCPRLLARGPTPPDAEFLAALALASIGQGEPGRRSHWLARLAEEFGHAFVAGQAPCSYLACLYRLAIADAAQQGLDPVLLLATQLDRCFKGQMPLFFAQQMLEEWQPLFLTPGNQARLRIMLFDRVFSDGWEIGGLEALRSEAPALAELLDLDEPQRAAELRWLWSLRAQAPWRRQGDCKTCFDVAEQEGTGRKLLEKHPDLLLLEEEPDGMIICSSGVYWRQLHFLEAPRQIRITERLWENRKSYTLQIGDEKIPMTRDPSAFVERLDRRLTFLRDDFQIAAKQTLRWATAPTIAALQASEPALCPECGGRFIATEGEVGRLLGQ